MAKNNALPPAPAPNAPAKPAKPAAKPPKKGPKGKAPPAKKGKSKTAKPGKAKTPCPAGKGKPQQKSAGLNPHVESALKGAAGTVVETKGIKAEHRYKQASRNDFLAGEAARRNSGSSLTWYKESGSTKVFKVLKGAKAGGGAAGAVVETAYQVHKTGGKLNTNAGVEIGSAAACGVATVAVVGTCVVLSPVAIPAAAIVGAGIATGVAIDYAASGPKENIKDILCVPTDDR